MRVCAAVGIPTVRIGRPASMRVAVAAAGALVSATLAPTGLNISVAGAKNPVLGRAIIVHAKPDDGGQPVGNAGARIAQGVIGVAKVAAPTK